jgi:hypothetical protein
MTIRLKGKALSALNEEIHERDNYTCIIEGCDIYVPIGEKFHHEPCGSYKEDVIYKGCCLCYGHHQQCDGVNSYIIRQQCRDYLSSLYPKEWESIKK